eukprot:6464914-Amphidinium_carterae.1
MNALKKVGGENERLEKVGCRTSTMCLALLAENWNLDESSVFMVPMDDRHGVSGLGRGKMQQTWLCLVVAVWSAVCKVVCCGFGNHWASASTLASLVDDLEKHMCERDNSVTPPLWILLLDCALAHLSAETAATLRAHEQLHIVFIQRNSTGHNQPLDIAYFRSFKATLRRG